MIPTHNSTLGLDFSRSASIKNGKASVIFSLEMSKHEITMRLLSAEARVSLQNMRTGRMTDDDWSRLARRMGEVANAPLFIDDSPNLTMMEIRAKARRLKQRQNLELIVVDYMQLMSSPKKTESRQQEVSEISRSMKLLAKELEVPVVAISQLNRGPEARTDKKPQLSDLRESGSLEQDADMVILLYREDAFEKESPRAGEADFIVAKHRNGPTGTITVAFQGHYSRFIDMTASPA
jgi:replicative DNA helicase